MSDNTIKVLESMYEAEADDTRKSALSDAINALRCVDDPDHASGRLQKDYWDDVRELAESIEEEIKAGEITDLDKMYERLHEDCDGHSRVIYTHQAKLALCFSDNAEAHEEEYGGEMPNWSQLAYCAFYRDVQERLDPPVCDDCDVDFATHEHNDDNLCKECYEARLEEEAEEEEDQN